MAAEPAEPMIPSADLTPIEWLNYLEQRIDIRRPTVQKYDEFYLGDHPLAFATSKFREAFGDLFSAFADNMMQLVVDVPVARLAVVGFDYGDQAADDEAWKRWKRWQMPRRAKMAHTEAGKSGVSYVLVEQDGGMTVEHALQCVVELDPADPMKRLAGLKKWTALDGYSYATVFLPEAIYRFRRKTSRPSPLMASPLIPVPDGGWEPLPENAEEANVFGVVSLVPLENNPSLTSGGISDLLVATPIQNAINKLCTDMIVASEYQAFKQRVLTGVEAPRYPEGHPLAGKIMPDADLVAAMSRTWFIEDPQAKAFELGGVDLSNYVTGVDMFMAHLATKTQIPPQHFLSSRSSLANMGADAMAVIESGFVSKIEGKQESFGAGWAEAMRLSLMADTILVEPHPGATQWRPASPPALAALADAMVKYASLGVPEEWIWQEIGATPEQIIEWRELLDAKQAKADAAAEALRAATPTAPPASPVSAPATPPADPADG